MRVLAILAALVCVEAGSDPQPVKKNVTVLVDVSGSMSNVWPVARSAVATISEQPVDHYRLKLIRFTVQPEVWPLGWADMPDAEAATTAAAWCSVTTSADTAIGPALRAALGEDLEDHTVVIVSDGQFNDMPPAAAVKLLQELNGKRQHPAVVVTLGIGGVRARSLVELGKAGGGGCWWEEAQ